MKLREQKRAVPNITFWHLVCSFIITEWRRHRRRHHCHSAYSCLRKLPFPQNSKPVCFTWHVLRSTSYICSTVRLRRHNYAERPIGDVLRIMDIKLHGK